MTSAPAAAAPFPPGETLAVAPGAAIFRDSRGCGFGRIGLTADLSRLELEDRRTALKSESKDVACRPRTLVGRVQSRPCRAAVVGLVEGEHRCRVQLFRYP